MADTPVPNDSILRSRLQILSFFAAASLLTAPVFVFIYWRLGSSTAAAAIAAAVPFLLFTYLPIRSRRVGFAGNWIITVGYCLFAVIALCTGGLQSPALVWSLCIPMVATLICGLGSGGFWLVFTLAQFAGLYWLDRNGWTVQQFPDVLSVKIALCLNVAGVILFTFTLAVAAEFFRKRYLRKIETSNEKLKEALDNLRTLGELLPICAWCKKIRNDQGYWDQIETYFAKRTQTVLSHGICPDCAAKQAKEWSENK